MKMGKILTKNFVRENTTFAILSTAFFPAILFRLANFVLVFILIIREYPQMNKQFNILLHSLVTIAQMLNASFCFMFH